MSSIVLVAVHPATRDYVADGLRSAGHTVRVAESQEHAWELLATERPDVVVLSLHHPDAAPLASRARELAVSMPVLVYDHGHMGQVLGKAVAMRLRPDAYVEDVSQRGLAEQVGLLAKRAAPGTPQAPQSGVAQVLARPAALQGQLRDGALATTLVTLLRTFRDGILVVQHGEVERRVFLKLGAPVSFDSTERAEAFDRWLVDAGRLTEAQLQEALVERAGGALSTSASLVAVGALEPGPPLLALLREHLRAMLAKVVGLRQGRFRFHAGDAFASCVQAVEVPALAHVLVGARDGWPLRMFLAALAPDRERFPRRTPAFSEQLAQLGLTGRALRLCLAIDGSVSTAELLHAHRTQLRQVAPLLWFLRLVEAVAFHETRGAAPRGATPVPFVEPLPPLPPDQLAEVRESALAVLPTTYFHALGVDIAADPEEVERAYLQRTEALHPDRFAGFDLGEVEDLLTQVQDKLAAAHRTLSSHEKRLAYLEHLFGKATGLRGERALSVAGEVAMMEAERALRAQKPRDAVAHAREAAQHAPREPDFFAHLALLELLDRSRADAERFAAARKAVKRALQLDPQSARAMVAEAMLAREEGDWVGARRQVLAALKLRPKLELARWVLRELNRVR